MWILWFYKGNNSQTIHLNAIVILIPQLYYKAIYLKTNNIKEQRGRASSIHTEVIKRRVNWRLPMTIVKVIPEKK